MKTMTSKLMMAAAGVVMTALPSLAHADRWDHGDRWHDRDRGGVAVDVNVGSRSDSETVYEDRVTKVWVPAEYKTINDRMWHDAVTKDVCDRVWVPDRYETRDVEHFEHHRRVIVRESVLVEPGHFEDRVHQVVVNPGYWEDCSRQVLVCDGHWEERTERVPVIVDRPERSGFSFSIGSFFRR